jgi:Tol biopolymer transport system component
MSFSVSDRVGRFEILGALGAGGMGEVYRARDHQLDRDVAIKVLPEAFSQDADRRRRFEQEARTAGGLNHPNIVAVYDVGIEGHSSYIVTEILKGETLQQRIDGRPLPVRKAVDYALQIASGLAAAHEHGVIHRDIKPGNLFVTTDGRIKILDFGIAKSIGQESANTETVTIDASQHTVIGTVPYMSPELARGLRTDHRTDIFSFGVVLYEMLSGGRPFQRATAADTLHAILYEEPPRLPRVDPAMPALDRIVRRCLEKKPEERFQNLRDLAFQLEAPLDEPERAEPRARPGRARRVALVFACVAALAAAAGLGAFAMAQWLGNQPSIGPHRVRLMTNFVGLEEFSSLSPDGRMVAFTATQGSRRQVFVRFLNGGEPLPVTSDDADHQSPRWLPDGSSLIYFSPAAPGDVQGALYRIPTLGGPVQRLSASIGGGDVNRSGRLAFFRLEQERIQLATSSLDGSDLRVVTNLQTRYYRYPRWSPDNQRIAFQAGDGFRWDVYVVAAGADAEVVRLTHDNRPIDGLTWLPDSRGIVYATSRGSTIPYQSRLALWEVLLNGQQPPRQLTPVEASYQLPDLHDSGLMSVARMQMRFDVWAYPFDSSGANGSRHAYRVTNQTGQVLTPTAAPDGEQIAYLSDSGGHANIWVTSTKGPPRQITFEQDPDVAVGIPIWSPDGRWIAFVSSRGNAEFIFGVWLVRPDGSELRQLAPRGLGVTWSPDSKEIYYVESAASAMKKVGVSGGEPVTVRAEPVRNLIGVHGATVYYVVERPLMDGRPEIEIRAAPLAGGRARVITTINASQVVLPHGPFNPALSPDGRWLAMPLIDGFTTNVWAVSTEDGRLRQVTNFGDRVVFIARRVSWSSDGRSILAAIGEGDADIVLLDGLIPAVARQ